MKGPRLRHYPTPHAPSRPATPTGTDELCDLRLRLVPPEQLGLAADDVPRSAWPRPRPGLLPPFQHGAVAYLRVAGPGVFVGKAVLGEKEGEEEAAAEPLLFVMVRQRAESLL